MRAEVLRRVDVGLRDERLGKGPRLRLGKQVISRAPRLPMRSPVCRKVPVDVEAKTVRSDGDGAAVPVLDCTCWQEEVIAIIIAPHRAP